MHLHDILKRLLAKVCFNLSFMCFSQFVGFRLTFNELCCWTQLCVLLSRICLRVTNRSWQTGPNESVLHFRVVFVTCWNQNAKLVQVVYFTNSLNFVNFHQSSHKIVYWLNWNNSSDCEAYLACICMIFWRDCWQKFVWMLPNGVSLYLLHFVSLLTICGVERNVVVYCHL